ncbi:SAM-dependent methyltransferase [Planktothricoides sp. SR001]|uniref:class I SAM-dependent methyltransferase n=1 Tax=Planktothricoides sp. SR001 TaxID=1705388 RepID=UPI0006C4E8AD|nr:class I SAM-dependent methyltransferase [Planktothricoides sp. SR001]KOR36866.1 SAM-dependent methyltransferase [Planktothricoides sp. SR001]
MENQNPESLEKIRQQFDTGPYPRTPLETSCKNNYNLLYYHNYATPFYLRNQKVIDTKDKIILDAGCGSGYKALALAEANPNAKIVGIDISPKSVELAKARLEYHGFNDAEFHVLSIEELPSLEMQFDYINCDEVLYLLPEPAIGLRAMKAVLKPAGIIRANLHSSLHRVYYYRSQEMFKMMGLMDDNPGEMEISIVRDMMQALKDNVQLKAITWKDNQQDKPEFFLANYLLQEDKGYTITEMFSAIQTADLEFISMVNWRHWELMDLFEDGEDLPVFLAMSLPELSVEERLHLFELLHPIHRLLDFWCGHPNAASSFVPVNKWQEAEIRSARVHLHPQLRNPQLKDHLIACVTDQQSFEISRDVKGSAMNPVMIGSHLAACLLPLWDEPQSVTALEERWLQIRPVDPITLTPISPQKAFEEIKELLTHLEVFLYVLLERCD